METPKIKAALASSGSRNLLKVILREAIQRDPVDAVNDVEDALFLLNDRLRLIFASECDTMAQD